MASKPFILQNVVAQVASKLSIDIGPEIVSEANERLRVLDTRVTTGKLSKSDRREVRAAVLLEYVAREKLGHRISWKDLAKACGTAPSNLETLHRMIGNYLQPNQQRKKVPRRPLAKQTSNSNPVKVDIRGSDSANSRKRPRRNSNSGMLSREHETPSSNVLVDLAIRLASFVPDPHGCANQARELLADIQKYAKETFSVHERRGFLYEMQRYGPAYHAAAFYHVATKGSTRSNGSLGKDSSRAALGVRDLVDASNEFTYLEVMQVLPHVTELAAKVEERRIQQVSDETNKGPGKTLDKADESEVALLLVTSDMIESNPTPISPDCSHQNWQQGIIETAMLSSKNSLAASGEQGYVSDEAALTHAANTVLQRFGLSQWG